MRQITRRQLKKAAEKVLLFAGLMALMMVPSSSQTVPVPAPKRLVLVSIRDRKLALLEEGKVVKVYHVAVGAASSPSPAGEFEIINRITNPTYYHPHILPPAHRDSRQRPEPHRNALAGAEPQGLRDSWHQRAALHRACGIARVHSHEQP